MNLSQSFHGHFVDVSQKTFSLGFTVQKYSQNVMLNIYHTAMSEKTMPTCLPSYSQVYS